MVTLTLMAVRSTKTLYVRRYLRPSRESTAPKWSALTMKLVFSVWPPSWKLKFSAMLLVLMVLPLAAYSCISYGSRLRAWDEETFLYALSEWMETPEPVSIIPYKWIVCWLLEGSAKGNHQGGLHTNGVAPQLLAAKIQNL